MRGVCLLFLFFSFEFRFVVWFGFFFLFVFCVCIILFCFFFVEFPGETTDIFIKPIRYPKWYIVALSFEESQGVVILEGNEGLDPDFPPIPFGRYHLAAVYLTPATTVIKNDSIYDIRPTFELSVRKHSDLENTSELGLHPAISVTYNNGTTGLPATNIQEAIDAIYDTQKTVQSLTTLANLWFIWNIWFFWWTRGIWRSWFFWV